MKPILYKPGQGRTERDVCDSAAGCFAVIGLGLLIVAVIITVTILGGS